MAVIAGTGASAAQAQHADTVGNINCSGTSGSSNVNVTGYLLDLQQPQSVGSQSSGAGAGKVTFSEAEIEVPPSDFIAAETALTANQSFDTCVLRTKDADGLQLTFQLVKIAEVKLLAGTSKTGEGARRDPGPAVLVSFEYGGLTATSHTGGGTSVPVTSTGSSSAGNGWNLITNNQ